MGRGEESVRVRGLGSVGESSVSIGCFLGATTCDNLFSLLSIVLANRISTTSSLCIKLTLKVLSLFSENDAIFVNDLVRHFSAMSLARANFKFVIFSLLLLRPTVNNFVNFLFTSLTLLKLNLSLIGFTLQKRVVTAMGSGGVRTSLFTLIAVTTGLKSTVKPLNSGCVCGTFKRALFVTVVIKLCTFSTLLTPVTLARRIFVHGRGDNRRGASSVIGAVASSLGDPNAILTVLTIFINDVVGNRLFTKVTLRFRSLSSDPIVEKLFCSVSTVSIVTLRVPMDGVVSHGVAGRRGTASFVIGDLKVCKVSFTLFTYKISSC